MGQNSYISQGSRSMQVRGSRVPSMSQATASFRTVKWVRKILIPKWEKHTALLNQRLCVKTPPIAWQRGNPSPDGGV